MQILLNLVVVNNNNKNKQTLNEIIKNDNIFNANSEILKNKKIIFSFYFNYKLK